MEQNIDEIPIIAQLDARTPRLNRRTFLKTLAAAALASTIPPQLSEAAIALEPNNKSSEISSIKRVQKLISLIERYRSEPNKENQDLLTAWLKFNAAESYAYAQNWNLTGNMLHHFLFGNGTPLDISTQLPGAIYRSSKESPTLLQKNPKQSVDEISWQYFQNRINSASVNINNTVVGENQRDIIYGYSKPEKLEVITSFRSEPGERELHLALGGFGVRVSGKLEGVDKKGTQGIAKIGKPEITVFDRYDWDGLNGLKADGDLKTFLDSFISKLGLNGVVNSGHEILRGLDYLKDIKVELSDKEGALLVEKGVANEFDIKGKFLFNNAFEIPLMVPKVSPFKR